jgi:hypothetical protein
MAKVKRHCVQNWQRCKRLKKNAFGNYGENFSGGGWIAKTDEIQDKKGARRVESALATAQCFACRDTSAAGLSFRQLQALCGSTNRFAGEPRFAPPWGVPACSKVWSKGPPLLNVALVTAQRG